jgi:hypothetical protein
MMDYFMEFHWWYVFIQRFAGCVTEAKYKTFKEGSPDHIEIDVERLSIPEGVDFPVIKAGDELLVRYQNADVLKGTFQLK